MRKVWCSRGSDLRKGLTLIELLVCTAVFAALAMVSTPMLRRSLPHRDSQAMYAIDSARHASIRSGRQITISLNDGERILRVTAMPNGSVIGAGAHGIDVLSGYTKPPARAYPGSEHE